MLEELPHARYAGTSSSTGAVRLLVELDLGQDIHPEALTAHSLQVNPLTAPCFSQADPRSILRHAAPGKPGGRGTPSQRPIASQEPFPASEAGGALPLRLTAPDSDRQWGFPHSESSHASMATTMDGMKRNRPTLSDD